MVIVHIVKDSICRNRRLTTFKLTFPRFILAEFNTHRALSRNTASSRAIPIQTRIEEVLRMPHVFTRYGAANKGMQAPAQMDEGLVQQFRHAWAEEAEYVCRFAKVWKEHAAKEMINRALEPFSHVSVIASATDWENFFALRAHPDAQPEFQELAFNMLHKYVHGDPDDVQPGYWHIPYVDDDQFQRVGVVHAIKQSIARVARVSYNRDEKPTTLEEDLKTYDRLREPGHMSPFEHPAQASEDSDAYYGNFRGWKQHRKTIPNENRTADLHALLAAKPSWITIGP